MTNDLLSNRYRLLRPLGKGGFGETFLAEDTHMPSGRSCVIKLLKPMTQNPQVYELVKERFQREAAILEELGEANQQIPRLYAYFTEEEQFYLVQKWIPGVTLAEKVQQQQRLGEDEVRGILVDILPVLDYIHSQKIVHRDIKPENIILRSSDQKPVLIDFGAVKEAMGTIVNAQGSTTSSIVIGTPGFMPSEQAAGRPLYSSDLYSLSLVAIYLLSGKRPQMLETDPATGEILWRQQATQVSSELAAVLDKAVRYHPRDRFPTAMDMLAALENKEISFPATIPYNNLTEPPPDLTQPPPPTLSPTIAVAPTSQEPSLAGPRKTSVEPSQAEPQQNLFLSLFVALLILGSLIGGSVVIGRMMTRSPEAPPVKSLSNSNNQIQRPSPEKAIEDYYNDINNGQYRAAWERLPAGLQNDKDLHPDGYFSYVNWWETIDSVELQDLEIAKNNPDTAKVDVELIYNKNDGKVSSQKLQFSLFWDYDNDKWMFAKIRANDKP
ncbi:MAG: serine/threonine-protein kinase [Spirulinaceae cyanobacterium]